MDNIAQTKNKEEIEMEKESFKMKNKESTYVEPPSEVKPEEIVGRMDNPQLIQKNKQKKTEPKTAQTLEELEKETIGKIKTKDSTYVEEPSEATRKEIEVRKDNMKLIDTNKQKKATPETSQIPEELEKENISKMKKNELPYVEPTSGEVEGTILNKRKKIVPETSITSKKIKIEINEENKKNKIELIYAEPSSGSTSVRITRRSSNAQNETQISVKLTETKKGNKRKKDLTNVKSTETKKGNKRKKDLTNVKSTSETTAEIIEAFSNKRKETELKKSKKLKTGTQKCAKGNKTEKMNVESKSELKQTEIETSVNKNKEIVSEILQEPEILIDKINDKNKEKESEKLKKATNNKIEETNLICVESLSGSSTSNEINEILPNTNNENEPEILQTPEKSEKQTRGKRKNRELTTNVDTSPGPTKAETEGRLSNYEKIDLFNGLIQHGSSDIPLLHSYVPNKSEDNIKRFVFSNKRVARYALSEGKDKAPIDKWLDFLQAEPDREKEKLHDLSRALKYIALFEPCANESESMLSDCYKLLSDCMKGDSPKHLNPVTSLFLHSEINRLIKIWKTDDFSREHKHLEVYKKKNSCYAGKKKSSTDNTTINPSISNPLKIPDSLLELKQ